MSLQKPRILTIVGTRPEAIKMAPVINALRASTEIYSVSCLSGQHPEMARDALSLFGIEAEFVLPEVTSGGDLSVGMSTLLARFSILFAEHHPEWIVVHGDTLTTAAATIAAFQENIKIAHVEAGLRTGNLLSPWPEEGYRKIVGQLANLHFASTEIARDNLLREGVNDRDIYVTGNTAIDALLETRERRSSEASSQTAFHDWFTGIVEGRIGVLVTAHRRENHGAGILEIARAVKELAAKFSTHCFIVPVHPNPAVASIINDVLSNIDNVRLIAPLDYTHFIYVMEQTVLILTDSGGVQEEAPSVGTPVLVMRDTTERPEAIMAGTARMVGSKYQKIVEHSELILSSIDEQNKMKCPVNPFGDGHAAERILSQLMVRIAKQTP